MKKVMALFLVLVIMAALVSGCSLFGKAKELKDAVDEVGGIVDELEEIADNEDEEIFSGQVYAFDGYADLLNTFKEFGYEWNDPEDDNYWSIEWELLGEEEVDGVQTRHLYCKMLEYGETEEYEIWFNDQWSAVKAVVDGEEKEGWEAEGAGGVITMMAQTYVNYADLAGVVFTDSEKPGTLDGSAYKLDSKSSENISLGGDTVKADVYKVTSLWVNSFWEMGLSEVGGKQLFVILKQGADDTSEGLVVTRAATY